MHYEIETLNPCANCADLHCGLVDGQECERAETFRRVKATFAKTIKELQVTREYIHDRGLEWDLLSYTNKKERSERMT